jgi:DNA-binding NtrC family response regulator
MPSSNSKHTVLIVDDDDSVRLLLVRWVEQLGYQVRSANSAEAAMRELECGGVDVAMCDVRMPGANGVWLVDRLREQYPHVGIVVATGLREMDIAVTLQPGVVAYIVKPFRLEDVASAIHAGTMWSDGRHPEFEMWRDSQTRKLGGNALTGDPIHGWPVERGSPTES